MATVPIVFLAPPEWFGVWLAVVGIFVVFQAALLVLKVLKLAGIAALVGL